MSNAKDARTPSTGHAIQPNGRPRPMSPHLQVWRWHVTMLASILTRVTGGALYVGALMVVGWLVALAFGTEAYAGFVALAGSPLGLLVWFGFTVSLLYHFAAGVRHLIWDAGAALTPRQADLLSYASIAFGVIASLAFWAYLFAAGRVAL